MTDNLPEFLSDDYYYHSRPDSKYQICKRCVMDTTADDIAFDESGECNFCKRAERRYAKVLKQQSSGEYNFDELATRIRHAGRKRPYDCIVGVSGGIDSSYSAYLIKQAGLRPLAVHLDNGWNSELSVKNIELLVSGLEMDLFTHVIDWNEFRDLQRSFIKGNVVDIELLTDHSNFACAYIQARKRGVRYVLRGKNTSSESIMPKNWAHRKRDACNIRAIHRQYGEGPIKTFPFMSYAKRNWYDNFWGIKHVRFLDYFQYNKAEASRLMEDKLGIRPYEHKHGESTFTWFYQNYILPRKFGFDKRRPHLAALVVVGQMSRANALEELEKPLVTSSELRIGYEYVIRKLGFTLAEFERYLDAPSRPHRDFATDASYYFKYRRLISGIGRVGNKTIRRLVP